jgi:hypothetical protein
MGPIKPIYADFVVDGVKCTYKLVYDQPEELKSRKAFLAYIVNNPKTQMCLHPGEESWSGQHVVLE